MLPIRRSSAAKQEREVNEIEREEVRGTRVEKRKKIIKVEIRAEREPRMLVEMRLLERGWGWGVRMDETRWWLGEGEGDGEGEQAVVVGWEEGAICAP
jgi:hypothetical protein